MGKVYLHNFYYLNYKKVNKSKKLKFKKKKKLATLACFNDFTLSLCLYVKSIFDSTAEQQSIIYLNRNNLFTHVFYC